MKVFLGGTCNESKWRDELISLLEIEYFNPVVDNWTPDDQQKEIREREICNFCLYCITPKMTGVYSIAEVVDDSNKKPYKTLFVILREDEKLRFNDSQWKSLMAVRALVWRNGGLIFNNIPNVAKYLNQQQEREKI